ncbi:MAG: pyridoxamine 5'-phosphate oxidase family protein [Nitrospirales bacterium]|nr:pyridoxamine 5'-phosphate oxidase family protein [Nitrospira sp.]MDR4501317.1 pyridoxamine 5'-phosphate oxidase family protein [Nitrospirales bacterium]
MSTTGSQGERQLQQTLGSQDRARRFYDRQMHDHLTEDMQTFIGRQEMMFIGTSDTNGHCDCSPRFGKPGFVVVLNPHTLAYPEFRGNGVFASLGNIVENPHIGLVFVDFFGSTVGLHVNGTARLFQAEQIPASLAQIALLHEASPSPHLIVQWVLVDIEEAYIHCSKHIPRLQKMEKTITWGTDDPQAKTEDFFVPGKVVVSPSRDPNSSRAQS